MTSRCATAGVSRPRAWTPSSSTSPSGRGRSTRASRRSSARSRSRCSPTSTRSTRAWSACWPTPARSTRRASASPRCFGDVADDRVYGALRSQVRAVAAARRLRGLTYCLIGGRSLGIDTTVIDPAQWMAEFGIDVDHVDQMRARPPRRERDWPATRASTRRSPTWSERSGSIHWTAPDATFRLTTDLLRRQVAHVLRRPSISSRSSATTSAASRASAS